MADSEDDPEQAPRQKTEDPPYPSPTYAWYTVGVLMVVYVFSFMDRQILNLLVTPIKADLDISDSQMSYLMGFSFALFYAVFGIGFGRAADSLNRKGLIAAGLFTWTLMTAGCGLARNYLQFLGFRFGVGIGEATLSPSAYSLITDSFPKEKLGRAISTYTLGIYIGSGLAILLGGGLAAWATGREDFVLPLLGALRPWQLVFVIIGIAGLTPLLLLLTIREPARRGVKMVQAADGTETVAKVSVRETFGYMKENGQAIFYHHFGFSLLAFSGYGVGAWAPTFMERTHGWGMGQVGLFFGLHTIFAGGAGIIAGGIYTDHLTRKGKTDAAMRVGLISSILWIPTGVAIPLVSNEWVCWGLMIPTLFFVSLPAGAAASAVMGIMPNKMRGLSSATYLFVVNLIGLGLGPSAVAWCTDYLFKDEAKLAYSILVVGVVAHIFAILAFWLGLRPYRESVKRLEDWEEEHI